MYSILPRYARSGFVSTGVLSDGVGLQFTAKRSIWDTQDCRSEWVHSVG
mgnify:CR=1 FL=1